MKVNEAMKLNRYRHVEIPRPVELFHKNGQMTVQPNQYGGEDEGPMFESHVDGLARAQEEIESGYLESLKNEIKDK